MLEIYKTSSKIMLLLILVFVTAIELSDTKIDNHPLRVLHGKPDTNNEYPFVVSMRTAQGDRYCTGSLIAERWVLSAAHCFDEYLKYIRFGNMSLPLNKGSYRRILKKFPHPSYRSLINTVEINDIGLLLITALKGMKTVKLSAVDYTTLTGLPVKYAGFGMTYRSSSVEDVIQAEKLDETKPLMIGEGIVIRCEAEKIWSLPSSSVCVAPKCSNKYADTHYGDSGGPVFYKNEIVAIVCSETFTRAIGRYTPVSPYINWINRIILRN